MTHRTQTARHVLSRALVVALSVGVGVGVGEWPGTWQYALLLSPLMSLIVLHGGGGLSLQSLR